MQEYVFTQSELEFVGMKSDKMLCVTKLCIFLTLVTLSQSLQIVLPGSTVTLTCEGSGSAPSQCLWTSAQGCCYGENCLSSSDSCVDQVKISEEVDVCQLVLSNVSLSEISSSDTRHSWSCDQGEGEVRIPLTIASPGHMFWMSPETLEFSVGGDLRLECAVSGGVPDGQFIWRIGDQTLRNLRPLVISELDGVSVMSQVLEITGNNALLDQSVFCYHIQLDHDGDILYTKTIETKLKLASEEAGTTLETMAETTESLDITETLIVDMTSTRNRILLEQEKLPALGPDLEMFEVDDNEVTTFKNERFLSTSPIINALSTMVSSVSTEDNRGDRIVFPTEGTAAANDCDEVKTDMFTSWAAGRLAGVPDFIPVKGVVECGSACQLREECVAWNYSPEYGCNLKSEIINQVFFGGWTTGKKCFI